MDQRSRGKEERHVREGEDGPGNRGAADLIVVLPHVDRDISGGTPSSARTSLNVPCRSTEIPHQRYTCLIGGFGDGGRASAGVTLRALAANSSAPSTAGQAPGSAGTGAGSEYCERKFQATTDRLRSGLMYSTWPAYGAPLVEVMLHRPTCTPVVQERSTSQ